LRRKSALVAALVLSALILVIFNFARDPTVLRAQDLASSALWVTITFAATTALNRAFAVELDHGALDGLLLAPVGREAIYLGKLLGNLVFTGFVQVITIPLFVLFFNLDLHGTLPVILLVACLATVGFTAVGTVFSALTVRVQFAELMLPVLLLPFMVPPLIGAAQVTSKLLAGRPLADSAGWLQILATYDIVFVTLSLLVFPAVLDE
jgi:heme exporter protein B